MEPKKMKLLPKWKKGHKEHCFSGRGGKGRWLQLFVLQGRFWFITNPSDVRLSENMDEISHHKRIENLTSQFSLVNSSQFHLQYVPLKGP